MPTNIICVRGMLCVCRCSLFYGAPLKRGASSTCSLFLHSGRWSKAKWSKCISMSASIALPNLVLSAVIIRKGTSIYYVINISRFFLTTPPVCKIYMLFMLLDHMLSPTRSVRTSCIEAPLCRCLLQSRHRPSCKPSSCPPPPPPPPMLLMTPMTTTLGRQLSDSGELHKLHFPFMLVDG